MFLAVVSTYVPGRPEGSIGRVGVRVPRRVRQRQSPEVFQSVVTDFRSEFQQHLSDRVFSEYFYILLHQPARRSVQQQPVTAGAQSSSTHSYIFKQSSGSGTRVASSRVTCPVLRRPSYILHKTTCYDL